MSGCSADVKEALTKVFKEVDTDNSGSIDIKEVETVFTKYYGAKGDPAQIKKDSQAFINEVDKDHDGKITLDEFLKFFSKIFANQK